MNILIMGAGAVGGYYGGALARGGADVTFVARGAQLEAMRKRGLRVESDALDAFTLHPQVVEMPDGSSKADLVIYCVKGYHNEAAMETLRPAVGESTSILTLQNGIGSGEQLAGAFGRDKVLLGVTYIDAARRSPAVVTQAGSDVRIIFGEEDGRETPRALRVREALRRDGVEPILSHDVLKTLWTKLVYICGLSGMTCITRAPIGEVVDNPKALEMTRRVMREAHQVGRAAGVDLDDDLVDATISEFQRSKGSITSSMHMDLQAGNPAGGAGAQRRGGAAGPGLGDSHACQRVHLGLSQRGGQPGQVQTGTGIRTLGGLDDLLLRPLGTAEKGDGPRRQLEDDVGRKDNDEPGGDCPECGGPHPLASP